MKLLKKVKKYSYWCIFDKKVEYIHTKRLKNRDYKLYDFLSTNKSITRDDFLDLSFTQVERKVTTINAGGKFRLTPINNNTWYIKTSPTK